MDYRKKTWLFVSILVIVLPYIYQKYVCIQTSRLFTDTVSQKEISAFLRHYHGEY